MRFFWTSAVLFALVLLGYMAWCDLGSRLICDRGTDVCAIASYGDPRTFPASDLLGAHEAGRKRHYVVLETRGGEIGLPGESYNKRSTEDLAARIHAFAAGEQPTLDVTRDTDALSFSLELAAIVALIFISMIVDYAMRES